MNHVMFAWELGSAYGHVAHLRNLALHMRARGATCEFAVRDLDSAGRFLDSKMGDVHQAPLPLGNPLRPLSYQTSYASLLYQCGWADPIGLAARLRAWRLLIQRSGCTQLIADHAPTALLAAQIMGIPRAAIGTGFSLPPVRSPFPAFNAADAELLQANEAALLTLTNQALAHLGAPPLPSLQAIFQDVTPGLFTFPELDPYAPRPEARYLGLPNTSTGEPVSWGDRREPRIVGYLRPCPALPVLIQALARLPAQVLLRVADIDPSTFAASLRPGLVIVNRNIHLQQALQSCDVCISHGQHGTTGEMLLAGKPGLLLPEHREHELNAEAAQRLGAAVSLSAQVAAPVEDYRKAVQRLLDDPRYAANARVFADRHAGQSREQALTGWCDALMNAA